MTGHIEGVTRRRPKSITIAAVLSLALLILAVDMMFLVQDRQDIEGTAHTSMPALTPLQRSALEEKYAPVLHFASGERAFPVAVDYFLVNCRLMRGAVVLEEHPGLDALGAVSAPGIYLDDRRGTFRDANALDAYEQDRRSVGTTVYVRTAEMGDVVIVQYWLFYVFNQGAYNSHEGDWEMVQVLLDRGSLEPLSLTLSRHHEGARYDWWKVPLINSTHPMVMVAAGSHAQYLPSSVGLAPGDRIDDGGVRIGPADYRLVTIGQPENGTVGPSWLHFQGSWGERNGLGGLLGTNGPPGPLFREGGRMWDGLSWGTV